MSKKSYDVKVTEHELAAMLVMSFRYAMGRASTAPSTVRDLMARFGHVLQPWQKEQIVKDIELELSNGGGGWECDQKTWREVQDILSKGLLSPRSANECPRCKKVYASSYVAACCPCFE